MSQAIPEVPHRVFFTFVAKKILFLSFLLLFFSINSIKAQQYNRGVGLYPGNPKENFAPGSKIDAEHYRNLALHRAVYQSSSYDYNLTGQLVTDGIVEANLPGWIVTSTSTQGILARDGREHVLDRHGSSQQQLTGSSVWVQVQMAGNYVLPFVDSVNLSGSMTADTLAPQPWVIRLSGSNDGIKWDEIGSMKGDSLPGTSAMNQFMKRFSGAGGARTNPQQMSIMRRFAPRNRRILGYGFKLGQPVHYKYYRLEENDPNAQNWTISDLTLFNKGKAAAVGGPYNFASAWKSAGSGQEWLYVDLGAQCTFNHIKLDWIRPAIQGSIQTSADAAHWQDIAALPPNPGNITDIALSKETKGRYVRVLMTKPADMEDGYILSELEVMGTGGPVSVAHPQAGIDENGHFNLSGGAWKLQKGSLIRDGGLSIAAPGYNDDKWIIATVPGTTLVSYLNNGAVPEPNFGDNNAMISDSYFYDDFWYRDVFATPGSYKDKRVFLNFDGINWEAEIYLNGHSVGRINGAFIRGKFDVTDMLVPGGQNVLAVRVVKNETPGFPTEQNRNSTDANGGELGGDNPTFHASIGWDWIPTIRGRNTGIWNNVYLTAGGPVTIEDPLITSHLPLPDTTSADINLKVTLYNHTEDDISGTLRVKFGNITIAQKMVIRNSELKTVVLNPATNKVLKLQNPKLWWPNGYGQQNLYDVSFSFITDDDSISDTKTFKTGVREMTYSDTGNLKIYVNGRRFIPRGGNMGFSEDLLRYRAREYDIAVGFHKEMNFNMIRNWVGQVGDDAFYEACDKYGIMVWQDFWLANPSDGPDPYHPDIFIDNMKDFVKRIRNHPSIALYVGRNEGNPPPVIQKAIDTSLPVLAPGIRYIPNSASYTVSGGGPYALQPLKSYFKNRATPKLHSEMGMPDIMSYESFKLTMPDSAIWPQSRLWGVHDFTLQGAQNGTTFNRTIEQAFGKVDDAKKWLSLAAWTEYQGYRAMFEAQSKYRMGLLIWMSHPSWPSLAWQSYDYYFEPTAAYFGGKKGSEPLHIQWNPLTDSVEVVNYSIQGGIGLNAKLEILTLDGKVKLTNQAVVSCPEDNTTAVMPVNVPVGLDGIYLVRLELSSGNTLISRNEYLRGAQPDSSGGMGNLKEIIKLPLTSLVTETRSVKEGSHWVITTRLANKTGVAAFNIRLKVTGAASGKRILPAIYDDNYFTLLPGDARTITMKVEDADTQGEKPAVAVEGFNIK